MKKLSFLLLMTFFVFLSNNVAFSQTISLKELPAIDNFTNVSVENSNFIIYSIFESSGKTHSKYHFYRSLNGGNFEKIVETKDNFYFDKSVDADKNQYCYAYKYENESGDISVLSYKNCQIKLTIEKSKQDCKKLNSDTTTIHWTSYINNVKSLAKPEYFIQLYTENDGIINVGKTSKQFYDISTFIRNRNINETLEFGIRATINDSLIVGFSAISAANSNTLILVPNNPRISELKGLKEGNEAKITLINGEVNKEYSIQYKISGSDNWTQSIIKIKRQGFSGEATIKGLNPLKQYCFRLQANDTCNNEIYSNEVCTMILVGEAISENEFKLEWKSPDSTNLQRFYLEILEKEDSLFLDLDKINTTIFKPECKKIYLLKVIAELFSEYEKILISSPEIIIFRKELPAPENIFTVSVQNVNNILISIKDDSFNNQKTLFYRSVNGKPFEKIGEGINNFYYDKDVDLEKNQYCYAYKYESECGVQSALSINKQCNIKLSIENTTLTWTPFLLDNSTVKPEYFVELLDKDGAFVKPITLTPEISFDVKSTIDFEKTSNYITPKFRILGRINYTLNVGGTTTPFPFSFYSNTVTYTPPILSTSSESEVLNIYPNPSEEIIQFNSTFQLKTAEIVDLQGKIVENQAIEENQVSVKNLPKGKYILRLYNQEKKLVVNKTIVKM